MIECALHDYIEVEKIIEAAVDFDDVGMLEIALNFDFPGELLDHVFFLEVSLGEYLYRTDKPALFLHREYDTAIGSFS